MGFLRTEQSVQQTLNKEYLLEYVRKAKSYINAWTHFNEIDTSVPKYTAKN